MHNSPRPKVLFLFRELAGYFISCLKELANQNICDVEVVYWPVNAEAPLVLSQLPGIIWTKREDWDPMEYKARDQRGEYRCVVVSGWSDPGYNAFVQGKGLSKRVLAFDTQWQNTMKMRLGSFWMRWKWRKHYNAVWVPGERQARLARAMGFAEAEIATGFYVADLQGIEIQNKDRDSKPWIIGCVARLVHEKGFPESIEELVPLLNQNPHWEIHIWGTGPLKEQMPKHQQIQYQGFAQPERLKKIWKEWDVFILASRYEPWGVAVHEAAGAGLPLIVSDAVGAGDDFVVPGVNGWIIPNGDFSALGNFLRQADGMSQDDRKRAREVSLGKAGLINHRQWCKTIKNWID